MRRCFALLFAASLVVLWLSSAGTALGRDRVYAPLRQDFPPKPGATPIIVTLPNLNPPQPPAASGPGGPPAKHVPHPPTAVHLALADRYVVRLTHGHPYTVGRITTWIIGRGRAPGRLVLLTLKAPSTLNGTWLSPGRIAFNTTYRNVIGLRVYVDLQHARVDAIVPVVRH
jgi:hypothetical protein